jgi:6-phosphogluconolactonase
MHALGDAPRVVTVSDQAAASDAAAAHIGTALTAAVQARGVAHFVTTGGSAAPGIYRSLVADGRRDAVPWPAVHVWWGDDRFVPRDHPLSNVKPFDDVLRGAVPLATDHLHPIRTTEAIQDDRDPGWAADALAADLRAAALDIAEGLPVLDLVLLGIGPDGHLLSVFPGSAALDAPVDQWALAIPAPSHVEPHVERVTMHPGIIRVAREALVVATGESKAAILADIFSPTRDVRRWPAQLALHQRVTWIVDEAAAAALPR